MMMNSNYSRLFPRQLAVFVLASAVAFPVLAQRSQAATDPQVAPAQAAQAQPSPAAAPVTSAKESREGFWGRINPMARKKWVNKRIDPIKDQLNELDEVNAKNARDIQDVDSRAQAGIRQAQSAADAANQLATTADGKARAAGDTAQGAADHVGKLNTTVAGLDQFHQTGEMDVTFHGNQPVLSAAAKKQLDELAEGVTGHQGYIVEMEAHSRYAGSNGIQSSQRLAEAVKRYLVSEHQIPVYRMHSVALGNSPAPGSEENAKPLRASLVHIRLMENSLAAQEVASPHGSASLTGAERP